MDTGFRVGHEKWFSADGTEPEFLGRVFLGLGHIHSTIMELKWSCFCLSLIKKLLT